MSNNTIQYIPINKIHPHMHNPRKNLGDLIELADSIKAQGILQNLTIVEDHWERPGKYAPKPGESYTVIIGHRRLAAAKLAGLIEVPCKVVEMTPKEQIATMLLENMQRNDLTIYEQAQGFQMMLDFGDSIDDIAAATGFSKTTVRHRVKLLELDGKKFQETISRGGTIQDYIDLEKIKSVKARNKVLEHIGTSDFKWKLNQAIEDEARPERKAELIKELEEFAKRVKDNKGLSYEIGFYGFKKNNWKKPKDANKAEYFFTVDDNSITLYKKEPKAQPKKLTDEQKKFNERKARLKEISEQAYESRFSFIKDFTAAKKYHDAVVLAFAKSAFKYNNDGPDQAMELLDIEKPKEWENRYINPWEYWSLFSDRYEAQPDRVLLILVYARIGDHKKANYYDSEIWRGNLVFKRQDNLDAAYDFLTDLGYELADEEQALRDGSHELYDKEATTS